MGRFIIGLLLASALGPRLHGATLPAALPAALPATLPEETGTTQGIERSTRLVLRNEILRLEFDRKNGRLLGVDNLAKGLSLLTRKLTVSELPKVTLLEARTPGLEKFSYEILREDSAGQTLLLRWKFQRDIDLTIRVELESASEMALFWPTVTNGGDERIKALHFPSFRRLEDLGESAEDDYLVHAFVRGMKVRNPKATLDISHNPIGETRYPQAYNGMTHQLVDFYSEGLGGFFFAVFDPHGTEKTLTMPFEQKGMGLLMRYHSWDTREGADMDLDFPFVLGANTSGDWYRAADHYRDWALTAPWCTERGSLAERPADQKAEWLLEDVGLATFGTSASLDQSAWYDAYHQVAGTPVFHVTAHDALKQQGRGGDPLDVQFRLHPKNLATFRRNGDYSAIFLADLKTTFLPLEMALEVGRATIGVVPRATPEACPAGDLWQHIHAQRAVRALESTGADSFYHDASAPNRGLVCESLEHDHTPGRGRWMNAHFRDLYQGTQRALDDFCGSYTPIGVELMHEGLLDRFDYYQARNGAGFMGALEGGFYRQGTLAGDVETVPVFSYLYHDYAPVALDGCGKLSERLGDVFYWMAGRVALFGGLFEINNEFSPTERFPGMTDVGIVHYRDEHFFDPIPQSESENSAYDPRKGDFVREIATARTDFAQDFLAYGRMLPPLALEAPTVELSYGYYNNIDWGGKPNSLKFANRNGEFRTSSLLHTAWAFEGRLGLLFVNLSDRTRSFEVDFDLAKYEAYGLGLAPGVQARRLGSGGESSTSIRAGGRQSIELPSRQVVLIEFGS